jgi:hypothetical protein
LSAHVLLIAAIFVPYIVLMVGLGAYIWHTGRPRRDSDKPGDTPEDGRGAPVLLRAA